jgi:hypothetical protein
MVGEDTVIIADLTYRVPAFQRGKYFVIAQFPINEPHASSDGDFPDEDYPVLQGPEGQLVLKFPMKYVWNHPEVVRPFKVSFYLNQKTGAGDSTVVAIAGPFEFQTR